MSLIKKASVGPTRAQQVYRTWATKTLCGPRMSHELKKRDEVCGSERHFSILIQRCRSTCCWRERCLRDRNLEVPSCAPLKVLSADGKALRLQRDGPSGFRTSSGGASTSMSKAAKFLHSSAETIEWSYRPSAFGMVE